jgi:hypothetical protein
MIELNEKMNIDRILISKVPHVIRQIMETCLAQTCSRIFDVMVSVPVVIACFKISVLSAYPSAPWAALFCFPRKESQEVLSS